MSLVISPNTYAGEALEAVIAQTVLTGKTIDSNVITTHSNIDKRLVVPVVDKATTVQDRNAKFNAVGGSNFGERYLDPKPFMINEEYDYSAINAWWFAAQQPRGSAGDFVPPATIEDAIVDLIATQNAKFINFSTWRGTGRFAEFGGINKIGTNQVNGLINNILA